MNDPSRYCVTEAPRRQNGRLHSASSAVACLAWIRARSEPNMVRLAIWAATPPPNEGPDAVLCLPVATIEGLRELVVEAVDRWDRSWLLLESAPRRHTEEAREALVELVLAALGAAAAKGVDDVTDDFYERARVAAMGHRQLGRGDGGVNGLISGERGGRAGAPIETQVACRWTGGEDHGGGQGIEALLLRSRGDGPRHRGGRGRAERS